MNDRPYIIYNDHTYNDTFIFTFKMNYGSTSMLNIDIRHIPMNRLEKINNK